MSRSLVVLPDDSAKPILDAIKHAAKSLRIKMFVFTDPSLIAAVVAAHRRGVVVRGVRVAQTGQHVCDRVGHRHGLVALLAVVSCGPAAWSVGARRAPRRSVLFLVPGCYQLDLVMPGSSPRCALERKQMRQSPNLRYTERGRPQRWQRV